MELRNLRLTVLLGSDEIPAWQYHLIEQLLGTRHLSVSILVTNEIEESDFRRVTKCYLYRAFERGKYRRYQVGTNACAIKLANRLPVDSRSDTELRHEIRSVPRGWDGIREALERGQPDVVLALGWIHMIGPMSKLTRFGVWYFWHDHGQTALVDGSGVGFWETMTHKPCIRSALAVQRPGQSQTDLAYESHSAVEFSTPLKNRNEHLWKVSLFVQRALKRIREVGPDEFFAQAGRLDGKPTISESVNQWSLRNRRLIAPLLRYAFRRLALNLTRRVFDERWKLLYTRNGATWDLGAYNLISPPAGRFWADPFVVHHAGSDFIFFEDASTATGRGRISVLRIENDRIVGEPKVVLDQPYHLSYPFVFEWNGETYMVPESGENKTVELYRCVEFPDRWEFVHNLMEGIDAYDATLFEHNNLWWMFVNVRQHEASSTWDELCLFYADTPTSQVWQSHAQNPVVSDVRCARPAGRISTQDGHIHRPSQDSSFRYGFALNINRIVQLSRTEYSECIVRKIEPKRRDAIRAIHTLNSVDGLTVIDALHRSIKMPQRLRKP
jgi:hypothetical protein